MADEWRDVVLRTIRESPNKNREGTGFGLWVIMAVLNDKCRNVTVRCGPYYTDKVTGEKKYPRGGLTDWDFDALRKVWTTEIKPLLDRRNPPPVPTPAPADEPPAKDDDSIEEVPW